MCFEHKRTLPRVDGEIGGQQVAEEGHNEKPKQQVSIGFSATRWRWGRRISRRRRREEVVFKKRRTVPDTPRASRANTPRSRREGGGLPAVRPGAAPGEICKRPSAGPGHR